MTKPRTWTHKIHKKKGPKRGFKSRSQRGGGFLDYFGLGNNEQNYANQTGTERKQGWYDWIMGKETNEQSTPAYTQQVNPSKFASQEIIPENTVTNQMPQNNNGTNSFIYGGRRRCTRCKKNHKHSVRCKK